MEFVFSQRRLEGSAVNMNFLVLIMQRLPRGHLAALAPQVETLTD